MVVEAVRKSATLIEALPYIKAFKGTFVVIKLGGSAQEDENILRNLFADIDFMVSVGMRPVVVYGGGKWISKGMDEAGKDPVFVHGQRVTDTETMDIVSNVLIDKVGCDLLDLMEKSGGKGELLNGRDHRFLRAVKKNLPNHPDVDLGCVGEPVAIDATRVYEILDRGAVPFIAPVACGCGHESDKLYNINGDTAASLIASDLHAEKLVFLFDMPGVYRDRDNPETLMTHLDKALVQELTRDGVIDGGMIPKTEACLFALEGGVKKAHIVPGAQPHALLLEIFTTQGIGTEIVL